ncbi:MAG: Crp/Fnr family transcriptional regulator [Bacteroidota bacterium]|nr:Crp/Fnr family transcriptional regulator [Bacteroidota bacterium]
MMEEKDIRNSLQHLPVFSALEEDDLRRITAHSRVIDCEKGRVLFREGDVYRGFYVVLEGGVKVFKLSPEGKETVLHIQFPPQTLAEIPMFAGEDYPAHAECLAESRLLFVEKEGFLSLLRDNPDLALRMLAGLSRRLRVLGKQLEDLTAHDVRTRLIRYLLEEYGRQKTTDRVLPLLVLPISKTLLAAHIGTTLETLSRTLRKMEEEKSIKLKGKTVLLQDLSALQREYRHTTGDDT